MIQDILTRMSGVFFSRILTFITSLIVAGLVSEADWGHISLIMSYVSLLLVFSGNMFTRAIVTYTAQVREDIVSTGKILYMGNRINIIASLITIILGYGILELFSPISDKIAENTLIIIMPCILIVILSQNIISYFQGLGEIKYMTLLEILRSIVLSFIVIISMNIFSEPLHGWISGRIIGLIIVLVLFMIILWVKYRIHFFNWTVSDAEKYAKMKTYFFWAFISALFSVGVRNLDVIIISEFYDDDVLTGIFKLSILFFTAFGLFGQSITSALFHRFAQLEDKKNMLYKFSLKIKLFSIPIYTLIAFILLLFSDDILFILFNDKYILLHDVIRVIIVASIFQIYIFINGGIWAAIGDMKLNTQFFTVYSITYILLLIFTLIQFDFINFPYAILVVTIFGAIYSELLLRKRLLT